MVNDNFIQLNGHPANLEDVKQRREAIKETIVYYPLYKELLSSVEEHYYFNKDSVEPEGLFIKGSTGVGKSTMLKEFARKFPPFEENGITKTPVFYTKVPVGARPTSLASAFLEFLGDPVSDKGNLPSRTKRLKKLIKDCEVQMVIIDEFQHLIDKDTTHVLQTASDWVKDFLDDIHKPIVLCGMPDSERIFHYNPQLGRRFSNRHELSSFQFATKEQQNEFRSFLLNLDLKLPFSSPSNLASSDLSAKIFYATHGIQYYIKELIKEATVISAKRGLDFIDEESLDIAYDGISISNRPFAKNPFKIEEFNLALEINEEKRKSENENS